MKMQSSRADGRGHWPKGRRRSPVTDHWERNRLTLLMIIDGHYRSGVRSARALADYLGYSDRTVRHWLNGDYQPNPDIQPWIERWIDLQIAAIISPSKVVKALK